MTIKAIASHEKTQRHKQNYEKNMKEILRKSRNKPMTEEEKVQAEIESLDKVPS